MYVLSRVLPDDAAAGCNCSCCCCCNYQAFWHYINFCISSRIIRTLAHIRILNVIFYILDMLWANVGHATKPSFYVGTRNVHTDRVESWWHIFGIGHVSSDVSPGSFTVGRLWNGVDPQATLATIELLDAIHHSTAAIPRYTPWG